MKRVGYPSASLLAPVIIEVVSPAQTLAMPLPVGTRPVAASRSVGLARPFSSPEVNPSARRWSWQG
jgi:hypothetical protein